MTDTPSDTDSDWSVRPGLLLGACYSSHSDLEGGYDYEFVETPADNLVCKICHYPSREPHLTICCGHTFCNSCAANVKRSTFLSGACPMCREEKFTTYPNKQSKRDILSLHVLCTNSQRGCEWIGEVNDINRHLSGGCKFEDIHCPNDCGEIFERQNLANHTKECPRRLTHCHYCCTEGEHQFIEGSHKEQCGKFPVPCPNKCDLTNIPREDLEKHKKVCPLEVVQCQYHDVGCEAKMVRKDLAKHDEENTNKHLLLFKSIFIDTQNKLSNAQNKLADVQQRLDNTQIKLADTQNKLEDARRRLDSTQGKLGNVEGRLGTAEEDIQEKTKLIDTLFGKWSIEIHTQAAKMSLCNQVLPVIIKMPDFFMNMGNKFEWNSDPFYTQHPGYKMSLTVVPAGRGMSEGRFMSVYLHIMDSPFDPFLKWKMRGKFQVTLLNQISDNLHYSVSYRVYADKSQLAPFWYSHEFISHEELYRRTINCAFIKDDDCIFFEVCEL